MVILNNIIDDYKKKLQFDKLKNFYIDLLSKFLISLITMSIFIAEPDRVDHFFVFVKDVVHIFSNQLNYLNYDYLFIYINY